MSLNQSKLAKISSQLFQEAKTRDEMVSLPSYEKFIAVLNSDRPSKNEVKNFSNEVKFILFYFLDNSHFELDEVVDAFQYAMKELPCEWFGTPDYLETTHSLKFIEFVKNYVQNKLFPSDLQENFELQCIEGETNAITSDAQWKAKDYFMAYYLESKNISFDFYQATIERQEQYKKILEEN